jgi:hypothetical protein
MRSENRIHNALMIKYVIVILAGDLDPAGIFEFELRFLIAGNI